VSGSTPAAVVVLAAGQGTRMRSQRPKVLHRVAGRSLVGHVLEAVAPLSAATHLVVVGHGRDEVVAELGLIGVDPPVRPVTQPEQRGTGHAVRLALDAAPEVAEGTVLVLPGDAPLVTAPTLQALLDRHAVAGAAVTVLTAVVGDPAGYGRIVRDADGHPRAIVEERDADEATRAISEVGTSIYAFDAGFLRAALDRLTTDNDAKEEYLTDVVGIAAADQRVIAAVTVDDPGEVMGVNDRAQLAAVARTLRDRILVAWMRAGVTMIDPETTWVDVDVELAPDVTLEPGVQLRGRSKVARGAVIGPDTTLVNTTVGEAANVVRAHCVDAEIGDGASVGPFAYLRPGSCLAARSKIGTFVEVKNSEVGEGSRVPHLTYVGDASIGVGSNIGASSVFVNYDGVDKHRSVVGDHVRTGSDNTFVAPVRIGDGAYTGAGSVIREDVPPGALAVSAGPQRNIEGWVARKRPGTAADEAARSATGETGDGGQSDESSNQQQGAAE
jgi:bifunctional UDP-N-acetylglucosamine pyrophosphorylase/glucosamine-1-phosphate N-acetyltransferase